MEVNGGPVHGQRTQSERSLSRYDPDDPYRTKPRSDPTDDRAARLDNELQMDPELAEGPASGGRIAMFAVAIAVVLGAVFYGLNNRRSNRPAPLRRPQNPRGDRRPPPPGHA